MLWWTLRQLHARAPHTRASAAELLGYSRDQRAVLPLMATLQDDHAAVRKAAAGALVQQGDRRAVNSLVAALQDESREVREGAAWALGWLGDARAVGPLRGTLADRHTVPEAVVALIRLGQAADTPRVAAWEHDASKGFG
jgi:HEAT repeat protein